MPVCRRRPCSHEVDVWAGRHPLLGLDATTCLSEDGVGCPVASSPAQVVRYKVVQPKGVVLWACRMQGSKSDPRHSLVKKQASLHQVGLHQTCISTGRYQMGSVSRHQVRACQVLRPSSCQATF